MRAYLLIILIALSGTVEAGRHRNYEAKAEFKRMNPCPTNGTTRGPCPGYIVDHVIPLKRGGEDKSYNMQYQTVEDAKAKDKWE